MTGIDHAAEAWRILRDNTVQGEGPTAGMLEEESALELFGALIHTQLAQLDVLHEIAHAVGVVREPTRRRPHGPLWEAAALLESIAIGDEGANREGTIARLVLQAARDVEYAGAPGIAEHALLDSFGRADHAAVREAVGLLGIKIPGSGDIVPAEIVDEDDEPEELSARGLYE